MLEKIVVSEQRLYCIERAAGMILETFQVVCEKNGVGRETSDK